MGPRVLNLIGILGISEENDYAARTEGFVEITAAITAKRVGIG